LYELGGLVIAPPHGYDVSGKVKTMSTASVIRTRPEQSPFSTLASGDRMTQREFHRRYELLPEDVKAELIGGIVYMASPAGYPHGSYHAELGAVLVTYKAFTPGVDVADNATTILGEYSEPQPDLSLIILPDYGGRTGIQRKKYLAGPAELIAEIADSSRAIDLHLKKDDYERAGVLEYIVLCVEKPKLHWFRLKTGGEIRPDSRGIYRSRVFPGLWIDGPALIARDTARLIDVVKQGVASPEHAEFARRLAAKRRKA
jgi:Uma2 family endonuclease